MTQAYAFEAEGEQLVLRINSHFGYDRDLWVGKLIDRRAVPFPAVLAAGETEGKFWAVSRRAAVIPALQREAAAKLDALMRPQPTSERERRGVGEGRTETGRRSGPVGGG